MNWRGREAASGGGQERAKRSRVHKQSGFQSQVRRWRRGMGGEWVGWMREGKDDGDRVWTRYGWLETGVKGGGREGQRGHGPG